MTLVRLRDGWHLAVLEANEQSPMAQHGGMEIAADDERKVLWAHALLIHTYGIASVRKSCDDYIRAAIAKATGEQPK